MFLFRHYFALKLVAISLWADRLKTTWPTARRTLAARNTIQNDYVQTRFYRPRAANPAAKTIAIPDALKEGKWSRSVLQAAWRLRTSQFEPHRPVNPTVFDEYCREFTANLN
jgi:hypothetical protein